MEFKNRNPRQKSRPMFDDISSARWLDDSVWDKTRRRPATLSGVRSESKKNTNTGKNINLNIKLSTPKFDVAILRNIYKKEESYFSSLLIFTKTLWSAPSRIELIKRNRQKALGLCICILMIFVVPITAFLVFQKDSSNVAGVSTANEAVSSGVVSTNEPIFDTVKPVGREFKKEDIVFDPQRKFAKFTDDVNGVPVIISQQPIPEIYKTSPNDGAAKIAKDFGAAELITFDGQQMYFGQDEKGPMTMIFAKNGNLVFVVTAKAVDKEALKVYAGNFE